ncbi:uncharacterized protein LOC119402831 isoform X1 [Rhipicephalus sanguineus]|uniref:uncharacterized protein LOC119402831 isoform X1 n=1 Tax=Rhipicephalus sanguineus TaxID=34632 RepID=UPI001893E5C5|nr:uncharacterized protein LOC119402831 isoform X1 [Rhipicephalus sanguineus]
MSQMCGLCSCKSCDDCQKALRSRLPSCLGGEPQCEEEQEQPQQSPPAESPVYDEAHPLLPLHPGAVTQEPSSTRGPADDKGSSADDEASSSYSSSTISKASAVSKDTTFSQVVQPAPPVSDSPQPGPSGTQPFTHVVHDVPSDYTTSEDSETPP